MGRLWELSPDATKCIEALKTRPERTKLLTADLTRLAGVAHDTNIVLKLNRACLTGVLRCEILGMRKRLWYLPYALSESEKVIVEDVAPPPPPAPKLVPVDELELVFETAPVQVITYSPTPAPLPAYKTPPPPPPAPEPPIREAVVRSSEPYRPREVGYERRAEVPPVPKAGTWRQQLEGVNLKQHELMRVKLFDLMNTGNPVVVGDPHMALAELMRVARDLYKRKCAPFDGASIDLHIALELKKVIETIEAATSSLLEALATMLELAA